MSKTRNKSDHKNLKYRYYLMAKDFQIRVYDSTLDILTNSERK